MTVIFDGKKRANEIAGQLKSEVASLKAQGIHPKLTIVCVGPDERAQVYIRMKQRRAEEIGIIVAVHDLTKLSEHDTKEFVTSLGQDESIHGVICQLPLAGWYDPQDLIDCIPPQKDVDGLTSANQDALEHNKPGFVPATPLGVMEILQSAKTDVDGKTACVIGRSNLVGRPLAHLLRQAGAKVLVAHKQTPDIPSLTRPADILISAAGHRKLVTADMVKLGAVVIDVGINEIEAKLQGDVDYENVKGKAAFITPVPGGVGPLTVIMLLKNVVKAAKATLK